MNQLVATLLDQLRGAWRFRWYALALAWVISLIGWGVVMTMPDSYEASARVFIDTKTTLSIVTKDIAVESNVETQIQRVRQVMIGGPQLDAVAREANLMPPGATPQERQALIARLRDRIGIEGSVDDDKKDAGLYVITYQDTTRDQALKVVDTLLNNFLESTRGGKRESSEQAQRFLVEQIKSYEQKLTEAEAKLSEFKKRNVDLMPGSQGDYFTRLQLEMETLEKARAGLGIAQRRKDELQKQLRGEQPVLSGAAPAGPSGMVGNNDTASRIRETQAKIDELLLRFTEKHPDVVELKKTLADLRVRQQSEIDAVRRGDPGAAAGMGLNANPVFQNIQNQLNLTGVEIAALQGQVANSQRKIDDYRRMMNTAPEIEAEFARLNRDYDSDKATYKTLVERLDRAKLGEDAEETGVAQFEVVDPPTAAFGPVAPNRPMMIFAVMFAALGAGAGLAYLLHQLKPVFTTSRQLTEITGLPVLGVVSMTWLERHQAVARKDAVVYAGATALLVVFAGAMLLAQQRIVQLLH